MFSKKDLIKDLIEIGLKKGDLVNVKISYKSIGSVKGGPNTVIEALLDVVGPKGTIFSDAFISSFNVFDLNFRKKKCISEEHSFSYAGAIPNCMIKFKGSHRSPHPVQKFVAIGYDSKMVLNHTKDSKPYELLYKLCQKGAKNLRIGPSEKVVGVGTTHCAIEELGLRQNIFKTGVLFKDTDGEYKKYFQTWPTSCTRAFNKMLPIHEAFGGVIKKGNIGKSEALLTNMKKTFNIEVTLGKQFSKFLHCDDSSCYTCNLAWENSNASVINIIFKNIRKLKLKKVLLIIYMTIFKNYQPLN